MLAMGLGFQIPVGILAACKLGITSAEKLRRNRRYAIVIIVVLASLLPTLDPVTLILEAVPLYSSTSSASCSRRASAVPCTEAATSPPQRASS